MESGQSIIDFDGKIERKVDAYVAKYPDASFETVHSQILEEHEGSIDLAQISPRCFEAAALRTPMVLFDGRYSGVLEPGKHFISLKKDFSNINSVFEALQNVKGLQKQADRTFEDVALNPRWSYENFINRVDQEIEKSFKRKIGTKMTNAVAQSTFERKVKTSYRYQINRFMVLHLQSVFLGSPILRKALFSAWGVIPIGLRRYVRPFARLISR